MHYDFLETELGRLLLAGGDSGLSWVLYSNDRHVREPQSGWTRTRDALDEPKRQLEEYFAGNRREFDLRLAPQGTAFQKKVWKALLEIPYGATWSYGALARRIGKPQAARAVGAANGRNPISIIVPCHRVIGSSGTLTGYGGGLEVKRALLNLERFGK